MESANFIQVDPKKTDVQSIYKLLIGSILPRPIAFVSTVGKGGEKNLAPFSFFNGVCSKPPCVMISIARKPDGNKKDSLRNIEDTKEFVVNSANKWLLEKLVQTASDFPYGINEMEKVGLSPLKSKLIKPERVKEAAFQMECKLYNLMEIGDGGAGSSTIIVGEVLLFHINEAVYKDGKVILDKYQPMARLGGSNYCSAKEELNIPIPKI